MCSKVSRQISGTCSSRGIAAPAQYHQQCPYIERNVGSTRQTQGPEKFPMALHLREICEYYRY